MEIVSGSEHSDSDFHQLTGFQRDLLVVILELDQSDTEQYGLEIKRRVQERREDTSTPGRIYPNLDKLVEMGYIERGQLDRRTNKYTPTDAAIEIIRERTEELVDAIPK